MLIMNILFSNTNVHNNCRKNYCSSIEFIVLQTLQAIHLDNCNTKKGQSTYKFRRKPVTFVTPLAIEILFNICIIIGHLTQESLETSILKHYCKEC